MQTSTDTANRFIRALKNHETNMGRLYRAMAQHMPTGRAIYTQMAEEEDKHAALLTTLQTTVIPQGLLDETVMMTSLAQLESQAIKVSSMIRQLDAGGFDPNQILQAAIALEGQGGELRLDHVVAERVEHPVFRVFAELLAGDEAHGALLAKAGKDRRQSSGRLAAVKRDESVLGKQLPKG